MLAPNAPLRAPAIALGRDLIDDPSAPAEAAASHRPASQILRELMREFVQRQRQAREYQEFLRGKVATARGQIRAGDYASGDEVEARFAARRAQLLAKVGGAGA